MQSTFHKWGHLYIITCMDNTRVYSLPPIVDSEVRYRSMLCKKPPGRDVTRTLIGRGVYIFIYSCFARQISFQIEKFEFDLKRNSSGRT